MLTVLSMARLPQNFQMEKNLKEGYEAIRSVFPDAPVLTTVRSEPQGGARDFTEAEYIDLLSFITKEHLGDAVDIEYGQEVFDTYEMIREAKRADMPVVMSWHSFGRVMGVREIIDVIENMQAMDADILKVATIVEHPKEAALVMYAAAEAQEEFPDNPVIVIGMGKDGVLTPRDTVIFTWAQDLDDDHISDRNYTWVRDLHSFIATITYKQVDKEWQVKIKAKDFDF